MTESQSSANQYLSSQPKWLIFCSKIIADSKPDNWGTLLGASAAAYGIGMLSLLVLPFLIGATMTSMGLDESEAGILGSIELLGVMLASILVAPHIDKLPRRTLAMSGAAIAVLGNLFSMVAMPYELLLLVRALTGFGCGLALAAGNATVANAANPEKLAAHMSLFFVVLMVVMMNVFSRVGSYWGYQGCYAALAITIALVSLLMIKLPQKAGASELNSAVSTNNSKNIFSMVGILMLVAMFAFQMRDTMAWAFVERIGAGLGYSTQEVGDLLSLQAMLGILGPIIATVIGSRFGLKVPVIVAVITSGLITVLILFSTQSQHLYLFSVSLISITYFYALSYLTALAAELDAKGRIVAASGGLLIAGSAVAPVLSGYLIVEGGYELMSWVALGVLGLTLICVLIPLASLKQTNNKQQQI